MSGGDVAIFDPSCGRCSNQALRNMLDFTIIPITGEVCSDPINMRENMDCTIDTNEEIEQDGVNEPFINAFGCPEGFYN